MKLEVTEPLTDTLYELRELILADANTFPQFPEINKPLKTYSASYPALSRENLAFSIDTLIEKIDNRTIEINEAVLEQIPQIIIAVNESKNLIKTALGNGAHHMYMSSYLETMNWIESRFIQDNDWEKIDSDLLPATLLKNLNRIKRSIKKLDDESSSLDAKVVLINQAHHAAHNLPTTLDDLEDVTSKTKSTHEDIKKIHANSIEHQQKLTTEIEVTLSKIQDKLREVELIQAQAQKSWQMCEEYKDKSAVAYRITNTNGLAGSFKERAKFLNYSSYCWIFGLITALVFLWLIGSQQVHFLQQLYSKPNISPVALLLQATTALLSVSAPLWFAWLATSQIHKLFKLSEDYGFKSSVSQSFEGYRKETADVSDEMLKDLLGSLLKIINEEPLRLVKDEPTASSPIEQIFEKIKTISSSQNIQEYNQKIKSKDSSKPKAQEELKLNTDEVEE